MPAPLLLTGPHVAKYVRSGNNTVSILHRYKVVKLHDEAGLVNMAVQAACACVCWLRALGIRVEQWIAVLFIIRCQVRDEFSVRACTPERLRTNICVAALSLQHVGGRLTDSPCANKVSDVLFTVCLVILSVLELCLATLPWGVRATMHFRYLRACCNALVVGLFGRIDAKDVTHEDIAGWLPTSRFQVGHGVHAFPVFVCLFQCSCCSVGLMQKQNRRT